nr:hypothetical protein GCM10020093_109820 [Planobispora longispora]
MTAAACATSRLKVGTLVFANDFRHPAVLAKEAATVDLLSAGRLELGLGTGWMAADYASAGLALDPPGTRVDRLAEAIAVLKGLWGEGPFTFHGEHYRIDGLDQQPKPVQRPHPGCCSAGRAARAPARRPRGRRDQSRHAGQGGRHRPRRGRRRPARVPRQDRSGTAGRGGPLRRDRARHQRPAARRPQTGRGVERRRLLPAGRDPQVLLGTRRDVADKLRHWRDTHDLSYFVLHHERDLDAFIPVVEELAGR